MNQNAMEILPCAQCGARNRVPSDKAGLKAKCGKCGAPLDREGAAGPAAGMYQLRCTECGAKNRIPAEKVDAGPLCGRCKKPLRIGEIFLPQPLVITETDFDEKVLRSPLPVLVFAWAPWCSTCRAFMPVIDDFARDAKSKVRVGKLNVDQNPNLSSRFNIFSVPQIFIFDNGQLRENLPGSMQKHEIMMKMAPYI
ncbi:MAG: thioredoxin domain-containing protein [Thermodesulfobacteriota bacterium]